MTEAIANLVSIANGKPMTTSNKVAEVFGKNHKDVLRIIDSLDIPDEYRQRNFAPTVTERQNPSGGKPIKSKAYTITKDGFTLLAMGFNGSKAMQFKLAYIEAFNAMEDEIKRSQASNAGLMQQMLESFRSEIRIQERAIMRNELLEKFAPNFSEMGQRSEATGKAKTQYRRGYFTSDDRAKSVSVLLTLSQPMIPGLLNGLHNLSAENGGARIDYQIEE